MKNQANNSSLSLSGQPTNALTFPRCSQLHVSACEDLYAVKRWPQPVPDHIIELRVPAKINQISQNQND